MISDNVMTALLVAIPATITSIGAAIVAVKQSNKASARTDQRVDARADEVKDAVSSNTSTLTEVHKVANGNFAAVSDRLEASQKEVAELREELARHKAMRHAKGGAT